MRVLRVGGEYSAGQQKRARMRLLTIAAAGSAGAIALSAALHPLAGASLLLAIAPAAGRTYRRYRRSGKGAHAETLVTDLLESLGDEYLLINDVVLRGHRGNVDHVLIGPCGVVVIVESHGRLWFGNGRRHRSISGQAHGGALAVKDTLGRLHPELKDSVLHSIDSVAIFTNALSRLRIVRASQATVVVRHSQLLDVILAKARRKKVPPEVAATLAQSLADCLQSGAAAVSTLNDRKVLALSRPGRHNRPVARPRTPM